MTHWQQFAMVADEFLLSYAQIRTNTPAATLFTIGHAAELYLKAAALKIDPNKAAKSYGHGIAGLLDLMHANNLLADYSVRTEIRDEIMSRWPHPISALLDSNYTEYIKHQELYWVAYYLADVKYLGSVHIRAPEQFGLVVVPRNIYWVPFFKELRSFLGWPEIGSFFNRIALELAQNTLAPDAREFVLALE